MDRLGVPYWYEALDYTHAKQNLNQIAEMIPRSLFQHRQEVFEYWKDLLWHGEFDELRSTIEGLFRSPKKRTQALKKMALFALNVETLQNGTGLDCWAMGNILDLQ